MHSLGNFVSEHKAQQHVLTGHKRHLDNKLHGRRPAERQTIVHWPVDNLHSQSSQDAGIRAQPQHYVWLLGTKDILT